MTEKRHQCASNLGFILAAAGSAVGLGNIWKFPGKVGAYGGGAFLLCYLLIVFLVGFPVMLAELSIGRATQKNVVGAFRTLNPRWRFAGYIGIVTLFVILSYYCVVGGWVLKYVQIYAAGAHFGAGPGAFHRSLHVDSSLPLLAPKIISSISASAWTQILFFSRLVMVINQYILSGISSV